MLFISLCTDKPDSLQLRMDTRPDHLAFLKEKGDALKIGGPVMGDDGETPAGSLLIFEDSDLDAARAWAASDPYNKAGLFESVVVRPWKQVLGEPFA